jgi:hypothetical protein
MTRLPEDNLVKIQVGPNDPEPIQIEEIIGLDDPIVSMPHAGSLGDISAQLDIARTSGRESTPNSLHDLITIYDGEESSEVSLVTLVQITEEKEPEKTYSPTPDAQIKILPQSDQVVKSILDTELVDVLGTQADSLKDELGAREQEEEFPHKEINISTADYQVSIDPSPDTLISASTLPSDEKQPEA